MFSRVTHSMWTQNHPHPLFCPTRLYTQWESTGTLGAVLTAVLDSIHQAHDFPTKPQQLIITYGEFTLTLKYGALGHTSGLILDEYEG
ncbi:hypothetical protein [Desulfovibrio inopinatus]|uniref:hypothetical protein n=1 Tax=Desulfovibrio inopinatus TaxID=102109 RepID=UPI0012EB3C4D|nr:hypothetical protein [Desulfovibrio inopinatus]